MADDLCTSTITHLGQTYRCEELRFHDAPPSRGGTPHSSREAGIIWDGRGERRPLESTQTAQEALQEVNDRLLSPATPEDRVRAFVDVYQSYSESVHSDVIFEMDFGTPYKNTLLASDLREVLRELAEVKQAAVELKRANPRNPRGRGRSW